MTDVRNTWLVTFTGIPQYTSYGSVKNPSQEADEAKRDWASALNDAQEADSDYDATLTAWRQAPVFIRFTGDAAANPVLAGRILTIAGVEWDLDDAGRAQVMAGRENFPPDGLLSNMDECVSLAESLGYDLDFTEVSTLDQIKVWATQDPGTPIPNGFTAAIYRQSSDSLVVRV